MKRKKIAAKSRIVCSAKITYPLMFSLLFSGCSYYGGQLSYFDFSGDNKKNIVRKQSVEKFWASVRPKTNLSDAHYRLGLHYQQMGEYDKAIGEFNKALRNDHSYCKAYNGIAMTYDLQKRCEPAHASYEQAAKCAPDAVYVYNNYACSSMLCGNYEKGRELLQKAEQLATSDTRIKNNLKIAKTIAIRENLTGYLSENSQPAIRDDAPSIPADEKALPDPVPVAPQNTPSEAPEQIAGEMPAVDLPVPSKEIAISTTAQEIAPASPQAAETVNAPAEDKVIVAASPPPPPSIAPIKVAIEVSNGNGTTGMAKRSSDFLRGQGFNVRSVTNATHFRFAESVIYYKEEYLQTAKDLAAAIPGAQNLELVDSLTKSSIGVRVLLGRDLASIRFPEGYAGLAEYPPTEQCKPAVLTASNYKVSY